MDSGRKSWMLDSRRWTLLGCECWTVDPGCWTLNAGLWALNPGIWTPDAGLSTLDSVRWTLEVKTLKFKTVQSFGNNGFISITSFFNSTLVKIFGHFRYENLSTVYSFQVTLCNHLKYQKTDDVEREGRLEMD